MVALRSEAAGPSNRMSQSSASFLPASNSACMKTERVLKRRCAERTAGMRALAARLAEGEIHHAVTRALEVRNLARAGRAQVRAWRMAQRAACEKRP